MAVDYAELTASLRTFYDFTNKAVLCVGAAGNQLLDRSFNTRKLIAVDRNDQALGELKKSIAGKGMQDSVEVIAAEFESVNSPADVVYLEFCLHETVDPQKALAHARTLASDVVVFDHLPGSDWAYYAAEEEKVRRGSEAMQRFGIRRHETFRAAQRFKNHRQLLAKVAQQGPLAIQRVQFFAGSSNIVIPMPCQLALL